MLLFTFVYFISNPFTGLGLHGQIFFPSCFVFWGIYSRLSRSFTARGGGHFQGSSQGYKANQLLRVTKLAQWYKTSHQPSLYSCLDLLGITRLPQTRERDKNRLSLCILARGDQIKYYYYRGYEPRFFCSSTTQPNSHPHSS